MASPFDPVFDLLRRASRISPDEQDVVSLRQAVSSFNSWQALVTEAENNAVAPLIYHNLSASGIDIPRDVKRQLYALVQRHRWANDARAKALAEIVEACEQESIQLVILKGAYLAHSIYPDPALRTMSDIDLLAPPDQAVEVIRILRELGYSVPEHSASRYMSEHHHLPGAHKTRDDQQILVEVHHDALSGDAPASITTKNLTSPLNEFFIGERRYFCLGYQDQLRHLYHHMSEPAAKLKLIWCVDIVFYASQFEQQIDWAGLHKEYPQVVNALRLVDFILALPKNLRAHVEENVCPAPAGTGVSILPLTSILRKPLQERLTDLLYPSNWWLRLYYGVSPDNSLFITRWVRHPWQVLKWISRRLRASRQHGRGE